MLDGKMTMPAQIDLIKSLPQKSLIEIVLKEGRNRQIRRTAELLGHTVIDLKRTAMSNIQLKGLPEGKWRELETYEWTSIISTQKKAIQNS